MSDILRSTNVTTKKPHVCFGCGREFQIGTKMRVDVVVDCGLWNCYLCNTCSNIARDLEPWDEFGYGDLRDEALERETMTEEIVVRQIA